MNKKYEAVITEVRELRNELISAQTLCVTRETEIEQCETSLRDRNQKIVYWKNKVSKNVGVHISCTKAN